MATLDAAARSIVDELIKAHPAPFTEVMIDANTSGAGRQWVNADQLEAAIRRHAKERVPTKTFASLDAQLKSMQSAGATFVVSGLFKP